MAMSQQPQAPNAIADATAEDITGWIQVQQSPLRGIVRVVSDHSFRLNLISRAAAGTEYLVQQVASGAVTVDGATVGYTNAAEFDAAWPAEGKVQIYNSSGAGGNWVADWRVYEQ